MPGITEMETERLRLIPLNFDSIDPDDHEMIEKRLGLQMASMILGEQIDREIKSAMRTSLEDVIKSKSADQWYVDWQSVLVILKDGNVIIGGFCCQSRPDENGKVQVGYMIQPEYQCNGYMTEALIQCVAWVFQRPDVLSVIADTVKSNLPSQRVLKKIGMTVFTETERSLWWKMDKCA
jgi:[ribosomal protein S5]-alanine N-acetyltransferase